MKITIDLSSISEKKTGIDYYIINLVENLIRIGREYTYLLYLNRKTHFFRKEDNVDIKYVKGSHRLTWMQCYLPFSLVKLKVDILHSPCYLTPLINAIPAVVTVHDMTAVIHPSFLIPDKTSLKHWLVYKKMLPLSIQKATKIIAVSEQTRYDIMKFYNVPKEKIEVIYEAISKKFFPIQDREKLKAVKQKYKLPEKYILFVGVIEPRKNISLLIRAFAKLKRKRAIRQKLVIVGPRGWHCKEVFNTAKETGLNNEIIFTGYVSDEDLPYIYNGADIFVYPSFYEGFGFPPLEAMACGVPVITSNVSSLPEVVGDAGIRIDPYSLDNLVEKIYILLTDVRFRETMIKKGLERMKVFSWEKAARKTLGIYKEIVQRN